MADVENKIKASRGYVVSNNIELRRMDLENRGTSMRVFMEIEVADLFTMLEEDNNKIKLIDIRNTGEYDQGSIPGSENLPVHMLAEKMSELDRNKTLVFYCQVGIRSAQICAWFLENGFKKVHNLRGGIYAWMQSGLQVA
ncbi:MAG TPA: rhodanese-like domain-containing protein [Gammaproteobacteria bacterium]|nr:rhodanese-like domain-containing protein [Gammaproteobacteria bacterium]